MDQACQKWSFSSRLPTTTSGPRQQLTKVHRNTTQVRIDCVSAGSFESISFQPMLALDMTDRQFNGGTLFHQSPQLFWNRSAAQAINTH
jgi:hypothetical protein